MIGLEKRIDQMNWRSIKATVRHSCGHPKELSMNAFLFEDEISKYTKNVVGRLEKIQCSDCRKAK